MAKKYELIIELYERTRQRVTELQKWQHFLTTACRNYRLTLDEQLLLFAQHSDTTALLEIEKWNCQFGHWVKYGATGIAVFNTETTGQPLLKYYFDVSGTHPTVPRNCYPSGRDQDHPQTRRRYCPCLRVFHSPRTAGSCDGEVVL